MAIRKCTRCGLIKDESEFNIIDSSRKSCTDCGEKKDNVSDMVRQGYSIKAIALEIEKTEVVCFNCHMRREQSRRGYGRFGKLQPK